MLEFRLYRLSADWVISPGESPRRFGSVLLYRDRVLAVGEDSSSARVVDKLRASLPEHADIVVEEHTYPGCAILPGLINAHTHLELSGWNRGFKEGQSLWEWIPTVVAFRRSADYRPAEAISRGIEECVAGGACGIVDIAQPGWPAWWVETFLPDRRLPSGPRPRVLSLLECIAVREDTVGELISRLDLHRWACTLLGLDAGISPHAPYTVPPTVLRQLVSYANARALPVAIHLAETAEEQELLQHQTGPFHKMFADLGINTRSLFGSGTSWAEYIAILSESSPLLIVHGNHLTSLERSLLQRSARRVAVVFCPRTYRRFGHAGYPLDEYLAAGIPVILGTDSRATNPDLSILRELQTVRELFPHLPAGQVLAMATSQPAKVLGWQGWGYLRDGASAQITVVKLEDRIDERDPVEAVLAPQATVRAVWIDGQLAYSADNEN
ncbi:Chlorohydrolase, Atz/Trz family [Thermogutta terrifontis]|uniref:Chlorohydrolase, Atz/Trz family n=1 Tax=Thermogutta terrifontis TaxID=1331910 RepID=A0A286RC13_9BACT|nr:amidohydrolase family protein [Thermogutta terrifontis]ASV73485.1 Chlorohydrolase, Atz/Trz family [Thermogutta terrifontis]